MRAVADTAAAGTPSIGDAAPIAISVRDFAPIETAGRRHILVLKLDHFGDFIIGLPALEALRRAFPEDHIRLICGAWNLASASASGVADEVRGYDYFPEHALGWNGRPVQDLAVFDAAVEGAFDIAIDLRVDDDTRRLLDRVDARIKCGIGSRHRFPFLDIVLPTETDRRDNAMLNRPSVITLAPDRFHSRMMTRAPFIHEIKSRYVRTHVVFGPYIQLPLGQFRVSFGLRGHGLYAAWPLAKLKIEVARDNEVVASRRLGLEDLRGKATGNTALTFANEDETSRYEFRVHLKGVSIFGLLQFSGVRLEQLAIPTAPRFRSVELHIGEQLSLLIELVKQRAAFIPSERTATAPRAADPLVLDLIARLPGSGPTIILAPFSNSSLRDWPIESYERLVALLLDTLDCRIVLVGSRTQSSQLAVIAQRNGSDSRILNLGGQTAWIELPTILDVADLVICNNSGIAHLAASRGLPTLAIYSGSHQPQEWGPRGARSRALMAEVACSPCGHDRIEDCSYEHLCMRLITPEIVLAQVREMLSGERRDPAQTLANLAAPGL